MHSVAGSVSMAPVGSQRHMPDQEGLRRENERLREEVDRLRKRVNYLERRHVAEKTYAEGIRVLRELDIEGAIELFESIPADVMDTTEALRKSRELRARVAAYKKVRTRVNRVLLFLGSILVIIVVLALALR